MYVVSGNFRDAPANTDFDGVSILHVSYNFRSQKPSRPHSVRAHIDCGRNCIAPILGEYPGRASPALFGVYIGYGRRAVEFYDSYPSIEHAMKAREYYICDSAAISKIAVGGSSQTHQSVKSESAEEGGSRTPQLALIFALISK